MAHVSFLPDDKLLVGGFFTTAATWEAPKESRAMIETGYNEGFN